MNKYSLGLGWKIYSHALRPRLFYNEERLKPSLVAAIVFFFCSIFQFCSEDANSRWSGWSVTWSTFYVKRD